MYCDCAMCIFTIICRCVFCWYCLQILSPLSGDVDIMKVRGRHQMGQFGSLVRPAVNTTITRLDHPGHDLAPVLCCAVLCCTVLCCTVLCCAALTHDVEVAEPGHGAGGVDLAHVLALVTPLHVADVQVPHAVPVVRHSDPGVPGWGRRKQNLAVVFSQSSQSAHYYCFHW